MTVQAKFLYKVVGDHLGWKKHDGSDMEQWEGLPATERDAFQVVADHVNQVNRTLPDVPPDTGKKPGGG